MKKSLLTAYCLLLTACVAFAVNGVASDPSRTLYSARQLGMGGVSVGFSDDASGIFSNPAGLTGFEFPQMTASSRKMMLDETQYTLAGCVIPTNYGNFGVGYVGMTVGGAIPTIRDPATGRITLNPSLDASSYNSSVLALSFTKELPFLLKTSIGGNYKFYHQSLSGGGVGASAAAANLDLGITVKPLRWATIGAVMQNLLGGSIKWGTVEDKLGGYTRLGGKVDLLGASQEALITNQQQLRAGVDLDVPNNILSSSSSNLYHAGLEYQPISNVAIRVGLNQEVAGSGITYGVGFTNGGFRFDYAYFQRPGLPGDNPHYFGLSYVGERVITVSREIKTKYAYLRLFQPRDRLITSAEAIDISAEAWASRVLDQIHTWTVTAISSTFEVKEKTQVENLDKLFINGKAIEKSGTIEARETLYPGRNIISLVAQVFPEVISAKKALPSSVASAEVKILRFTPFADTPMDFWAIEPIALNVTLGLVTGYPDNTFKPEKGITRAELVTLLVRSTGIPAEALDQLITTEAFKDVPSSSWAFKYVGYGSTVNYVTGYPDGGFKPNKVLSRAEAVAIFSRYAGLTEEATAAPAFADLKPDFWANKFIAPAKTTGLLKYLAGKEFIPSAEFTRAEACEVLYQVPAIQKKVNQFWETGVVSSLQPTSPNPLPAVTVETKPVTLEASPTSEVR